MSRLTLKQANTIVEVALKKAREMKVKPLAVAVIDEAGHVAVGKALAAVGMGVSSRTLLERAKGNPQFFNALSSTRFIPQTGAVVIKDKDGHVIGAAGASGGTGEEDEAVCMAGIEAAGLAWG